MNLRDSQAEDEISGSAAWFRKRLQDPLNAASHEVSRICPYPSVTFTIKPKDRIKLLVNDVKTVEMGDICLFIKQESAPFVFRPLTHDHHGAAYDISQMLYWRFAETAEAVLPTKQNINED